MLIIPADATLDPKKPVMLMNAHAEVLRNVGQRMKDAGVADQIPTSEHVLAIAAELNKGRDKPLNCARMFARQLTGAEMLSVNGRQSKSKTPKKVDFSDLKKQQTVKTNTQQTAKTK